MTTYQKGMYLNRIQILLEEFDEKEIPIILIYLNSIPKHKRYLFLSLNFSYLISENPEKLKRNLKSLRKEVFDEDIMY